jgi:hypothetical protein
MMIHTELYREIIESRIPPMSVESTGEVVSKYSPDEIRQTISRLVREDNSDMAFALGEAGLALYSKSEDMLAICGLLAMLREDWVYAVTLLNELLVIQGDMAPVTTHLMFIRSLRCALEPAAALSAVMIAHEQYPNHPELEAEFQAISTQLGLKSAELAE